MFNLTKLQDTLDLAAEDLHQLAAKGVKAKSDGSQTLWRTDPQHSRPNSGNRFKPGTISYSAAWYAQAQVKRDCFIS
jgi:hypothetical protein